MGKRNERIYELAMRHVFQYEYDNTSKFVNRFIFPFVVLAAIITKYVFALLMEKEIISASAASFFYRVTLMKVSTASMILMSYTRLVNNSNLSDILANCICQAFIIVSCALYNHPPLMLVSIAMAELYPDILVDMQETLLFHKFITLFQVYRVIFYSVQFVYLCAFILYLKDSQIFSYIMVIAIGLV